MVETQGKGTVDDIIGWLHAYANERVNSVLIDERRCIPPYIILDLGNRGLFGVCVPKSYGGLGMGMTECCRIAEALSAIDPAISSLVMVHNTLGVYPLMTYGRTAMKEEFLPQLAHGRILGTLAYTESGAGSQADGIAAVAEPSGTRGCWRLNGRKIWIGNASWSGILNVFIKVKDTDGDHDKIAGFSIPQGTPGMSMGPEALTLGVHGMVQNSVILENVPAQEEWLLGALHEGKKVRDNTFNGARLIIGACSLGVMKRALQLWMRYASHRRIATGRLLDNAVTLARLGASTAKVAALECLLYPLAAAIDSGAAVPREMNIVCKVVGSEWGAEVVDAALQGIGGRAYIETSQLPQLYRDIRLTRIFEGPTETLLYYLGISFLRTNTALYNYLKEALDAADICGALKDVLQEVKEKVAARWGAATLHQRSEWTYVAAARVVCAAIVWAAVRRRVRCSPSPHLRAVEAWAQLEYEQQCQRALRGEAMEAAIPSSHEVSLLVSTYAAAIGDVEQTLAGADYRLDPLLKRE